MYKRQLQYFAPYRIWFPEDVASTTGALPVVLVANGTGVAAAKYPAWFEHLASWGFIVVGTDDAFSWSGFSQGMAQGLLQRLNTDAVQPGWSDNPLRGKVDLGRAGIAGHSQGGVGAVSYTHLRAHETVLDLVCRLLLEKKKHKSTTERTL